MLDEINLVRAQIVSVLEGAGFTVFSQRHIQADSLTGLACWLVLAFTESGREDDGLSDDFETRLTVTLCHEVPVLDADLETIAHQVKQLLEGDEVLATIMRGMDYLGHDYPPDQDSVFVTLETHYSVKL